MPSQVIHEKWCDVEIEKNPKCTCGAKAKVETPQEHKHCFDVETGLCECGVHYLSVENPRTDPRDVDSLEDTQPTGEWEKEFDEKFSLDWWKGFGTSDDIDKKGIEGIKSFISNLLLTHREKVIKEIEDILTDTNWIEEPKSAYGKLEKLLAHLKSNLK